ncbi:DMT family transporter [Lactiplantibacillus plantarum]|uniref:DMT family transporter n=1 Tax=Lactiplantibacillus plantarum TaxID=1590 RepID=UPI002013240A|nr:multidrug efflux SMR transporter [Lactiplantibacillus plantarum]
MFLFTAILGEVVGTAFLNTCNGFTRLYPSILAVVFYAICLYCLSMSMKTLDLNVVYVLWAGLGIVLVALVSVFMLKEPFNFANIIGIVFIIVGSFILNFFGAQH